MTDSRDKAVGGSKQPAQILSFIYGDEQISVERIHSHEPKQAPEPKQAEPKKTSTSKQNVSDGANQQLDKATTNKATTDKIATDKLTTDKITIKVQPDGRVQVVAPRMSSNTAVLAAVKKRSRWIYKQRQYFSNQYEQLGLSRAGLAQAEIKGHASVHQYVSGSSHHYLGRRYLLKVTTDANRANEVKLVRGKLQLTLSNEADKTDTVKIKKLLDTWYRTRAKAVFAQCLQRVLEQTLWVEGTPPMQLLNMKSQWGSCSPSGKIILNPQLIKAPKVCIDYVIIHELCHLAEHNHSERFYRLMSQVMPNWKAVQARLDSMAVLILS